MTENIVILPIVARPSEALENFHDFSARIEWQILDAHFFPFAGQPSVATFVPLSAVEKWAIMAEGGGIGPRSR